MSETLALHYFSLLSSAYNLEPTSKHGKSEIKGKFYKTARDQSVEILEDHHGCIKTLLFGNRVGTTSAQNLKLNRIRAVAWPDNRFTQRSKESSVFAKHFRHSSLLRKFRTITM